MPRTRPDDGSGRPGSAQPSALLAQGAAPTPDGRRARRGGDRRWLIPLIVATALTLVAGIGLSWDRSEDEGKEASAPSDATTTPPPPVTPAGYLDRTRALYDEVADAVQSAEDVDQIADAAEVAAGIEPEIAALVTSSAALDPLPAPAQSALLSKRSDFVHAVGAFVDLDAPTLENFGELAATLGSAASQLDRAESAYASTGPGASDHGAAPASTPADPDAGGTALTLVSTPDRAPETPSTEAASAAAHLTSVIGTAAVSTSTANLIDAVGDVSEADKTADVRAAVAEVSVVSAYATAASAGLGAGSSAVSTLDALAALATTLGGLRTLDGDRLDAWDGVAGPLQAASGAVGGELATATQTAYAHLDTLVTSARATIAAWENEVELARGNSTESGELETYADTTFAQIRSYTQLIGRTPHLSATATAGSADAAALFRLEGAFAALTRSAAASAPAPMAQAHAGIVQLFEDGVDLAGAAEEAARASQECQAEVPEETPEETPEEAPQEAPADGTGGPTGTGEAPAAPTSPPTPSPTGSPTPTPDPVDCSLGAQEAWDDYTAANSPARRHAAAQARWETALAQARDAIAEQIAPPRPVV